MEDDSAAGGLGKGGEMRANARGERGGLDPLLRGGAGGRQLVDGNGGEGCLAARRPREAKGGPLGDAGEPGREARRLAESAQVGVGFDEGVLGRVEGRLDVAKPAEGDGEDGGPVARDESAEGVAVSGEHGENQLFVAACVHHWGALHVAVGRTEPVSLIGFTSRRSTHCEL